VIGRGSPHIPERPYLSLFRSWHRQCPFSTSQTAGLREGTSSLSDCCAIQGFSLFIFYTECLRIFSFPKGRGRRSHPLGIWKSQAQLCP
jgi:hypothetical protein